MKKGMKIRLRTKAIITLAVLAVVALAIINIVGIGGASKLSVADQKIIAEYRENSDICAMNNKEVIKLCRKDANGDYEFKSPKKHLYRYKRLVEVTKGKKSVVVRYSSKDKYEVIYTFNKKGLVEICIFDKKKDVLMYQSKSQQVKYRKFTERWNLNDVLKIKEA